MIRSLSTVGCWNYTAAENINTKSKLIAAIDMHAPDIVPSLYSLGTA